MVNQTYFWAATAVYAVIVFYLAWLGYKRTKCNADYMLAGRNIHPVILGLSYGATFISTSAIVGFGGYAHDWAGHHLAGDAEHPGRSAHRLHSLRKAYPPYR